MTESNTTELAAVQSASLAKLTIKETVLAQFRDTENMLIDLAKRYRNVAYDVRSPKGMKDAIAARADLRDNGRLFVTKAETRIKSEVNDLKRVMAEEVKRLVEIVQPVEEAIDLQIKAEENRKAAEKAERDRIEAERVAKHRAGIDKLKGYVSRAQGQPLEALEKAIAVLRDLPIGAEFEEFEAEAKAARDATVQALGDMASKERERLAKEAENQRLAAELAATKAELERVRQASLAPVPQETTQPTEHTLATAPPSHQTVVMPASEPSIVLTAAAPKAHEDGAVIATLPAGTVIGAPAEDDTLINLGEINQRLGVVSITADTLATLGFKPRTIIKNAKLYRQSDVPAMFRALGQHILKLAEQASR